MNVRKFLAAGLLDVARRTYTEIIDDISGEETNHASALQIVAVASTPFNDFVTASVLSVCTRATDCTGPMARKSELCFSFSVDDNL